MSDILDGMKHVHIVAILTSMTLTVIVGCASLKERVILVNPGATQSEVYQRVGVPDNSMSSAGLTVWEYSENYDTCRIGFRDGVVTETAVCRHDGAAEARDTQARAAAFAAFASAQSQNQPRSAGEYYLQGNARTSGPSPATISVCGYPPYTRVGCTPQCQNGRWVEVCQ